MDPVILLHTLFSENLGIFFPFNVQKQVTHTHTHTHTHTYTHTHTHTHTERTCKLALFQKLLLT